MFCRTSKLLRKHTVHALKIILKKEKMKSKVTGNGWRKIKDEMDCSFRFAHEI